MFDIKLWPEIGGNGVADASKKAAVGKNLKNGGWSWPISRVLSWAAIHLGRWSPIASSSLPAGFGEPPMSEDAPAYLALLRVGFTLPSVLPRPR